VVATKDRSRTAITLSILWRRLRKVGPLFLGIFVAVAFALYAIEPSTPNGGHFDKLQDAFWFCIVTMSTVGYGDVYPVTAAGRAITGFFILFTLGTLGLLITAVSEAVMEVKRMEEHGLIGTRMKGHVIVCGFNAMARAALAELVAQDRPVALLCESQAEIEAARDFKKGGGMFITSGEPSQELFADRLNAKEADAVIVAMSDDTRNLIATLNMKAVNPNARLVVALQREELRQTLLAGGVTYIASPNELSGRLVASAAFEPEVALLLEDLMSSEVGGSDMQQYTAGDLGGRTVGELHKLLIELDGPLMVAIAKRTGNGNGFEVLPNPARDLRVEREDQVIVISNDEQAARLEGKFSMRQGR
jgi:voltage-gated potassium channel